MITNKQEQGFKILNGIVTSEFPFIKKVIPIEEGVYTWSFSFDVILHIDILLLSKFLGLELSERFRYMDKKTFNMVIEEWNTWGLNFVYHFFEKNYEPELSNDFNKKIENFMFRAYSQLPKDFRINVYEGRSKQEKDSLDYIDFNEPKKPDIGKIIFQVK
jgi:hypothetical protein